MSQPIEAALRDVTERADQLVLNYVSRAADAAHGVLRSDQRLAFSRRLRARIEEERRGRESLRETAKVLATFGDPVALVEREARRLAEAGVPTRGTAREGPPTREWPPTRVGGAGVTRGAGVVRAADVARAVDVAGPAGVARGAGVSRGAGGGTLVGEHPREVAALVVLVVAALLVPFEPPSLAIFPVPLVVWAAGSVLVLFGENWQMVDRIVGIGAPIVGYTAGGVIVGGLRMGADAGLGELVRQFFDVSGTMFMIGTVLGIVWLGYRLLVLS